MASNLAFIEQEQPVDSGREIRVAIVDYGLGNLFSVKHACAHAGMSASITSSPGEITGADVVILPGMGAFGDAMDALKRLDLVSPLTEVFQSGKPLVGVCLGLQLLMTESYEFGTHKGLGFINGPVVQFDNPLDDSGRLKVPQICWNSIFKPTLDDATAVDNENAADPWAGSPVEGLRDGEYMYFVHSYYAKPEDPSVVLSVSRYGNIEFCSSLRYRNVFASQFHPERSGPEGLKIYGNIAAMIRKNQYN